MRIVLVHNAYGKFSGEEAAVENLKVLLRCHGHQILPFERNSAAINHLAGGKIRAFFSGIYNPFSRRAFARFLKVHKPDLVHVHNLLPLISPAILPECRRQNIPVVMTVHNFRLVCPNGLLFSRKQLCHQCLGGKEYYCVWNNCQDDYLKSIGYALRTFIARTFKLYKNHVDSYICLSDFQKRILVEERFSANRITVLPNPIFSKNDTVQVISGNGAYVAYAGRISPEKDIYNFIEAARLLPDIPFKAAGDYEQATDLVARAPANVKFVGHLRGKALFGFYRDCRFFFFSSRCYEGFPMVLVEAMQHGKPIVCSNLGGLPEIVENGKNGLLCQPGNARDMSKKIRKLWDDTCLCRKLGQSGLEKARQNYDPDIIYEQLMNVYNKVINRSN
jgi:glycosyltransferase involved in cell wall biosynthesis